MKKLLSTVLLVALATTMAIVAFACSGAAAVKTGTAKAYALVHGQGYLGSVTAVVDSDSKVHYVQINEYFLPSTWTKAAITASKKVVGVDEGILNEAKKELVDANAFIVANAVANTVGSPASGTKFTTQVSVATVAVAKVTATDTTVTYDVTVTTANFAKYIKIADKYFEATFTGAALETTNAGSCYTTNPVYKEIGVTGGIDNLDTYLKPSGATFDNTLNTAASKWYGEAVEKGEVWVMQESSATTAVTVGSVKLAYDAKAVGASGGINKRFGSYGNASYSWMKSILIIEDYVYANGFSFVKDDIDGIKTSSGATATDTADYMLLAKSACELAKANA